MRESVWSSGWTLWDLVGFLKNEALGSHTIYRGQSEAHWKLIPGLFRHNLVSTNSTLSQAQLYAELENRWVEEFFAKAHLLLPRMDRHSLLDRVIAQHYGVPTQLLDWTKDPFVALFFAVHGHKADADASFYYVSLLRTTTIRAGTTFPHSGPILGFSPPVIDDRIRTQKSVFTIQSFGDGEKFTALDDRRLIYKRKMDGTHPSDEVDSMGKIVIPAQHKHQIQRGLQEIGVNAGLIFPGLSGIGRAIADEIDMQGGL